MRKKCLPSLNHYSWGLFAEANSVSITSIENLTSSPSHTSLAPTYSQPPPPLTEEIQKLNDKKREAAGVLGRLCYQSQLLQKLQQEDWAQCCQPWEYNNSLPPSCLHHPHSQKRLKRNSSTMAEFRWEEKCYGTFSQLSFHWTISNNQCATQS